MDGWWNGCVYVPRDVCVCVSLSLNVCMNWDGMKVKEASTSPKKNIVPQLSPHSQSTLS